MRIFFFLLLVAALSGCATRSQSFAWTVNTNPQSATVINANGQTGISPVTFFYVLTPHQISGQDNIYLGEVTATWLSGATTKQIVSVNIAQGWDQQTTIQRPNAPSLDRDVQYDMNLQNIEQQQLQQDAPKTTTCELVFGQYEKYQCLKQ
jgi:hypothetical protein